MAANAPDASAPPALPLPSVDALIYAASRGALAATAMADLVGVRVRVRVRMRVRV